MKRSIFSAVSLVLLSSLVTAQAQEQSTDAAKAKTEDTTAKDAKKNKAEVIQVTGSRIKQIDVESAVPITTFSKEDIARSGVSNVSDFIRNKIPSGAMTTENATLSQSAGTATFGGRDFDPKYTLVLVNGRRLPTNAIEEDSVDLNLIPLAAVERIEYLTSGGSAIYGSDAVAGVLNIITLKQFNGTSARGRAGTSYKKDGTETSFQVVSGASSEKSNFLIAADFFKREPVKARDRPLIKSAVAPNGKDGRSPNGLPGYVVFGDGVKQTFDDCPAENIRSGACRYDIGDLYEAIPKSERQSIYTILDHQISDNVKLFGEARFSRTYTLVKNGAAPGPVAISKDAKNNPYGEDITVVRRYLEFGPRASDNINQSVSLVYGVSGTIFDNVNWELAATKHRLMNLQMGRSGNINKVLASEYFNDGTLNPFIYNEFNTPEKLAAKEAMESEIFRVGEADLETYTLNFDGQLPVTLPGGAIGYAAGMEYRQEKFKDRSDSTSSADQILGSAGGNGGGEQEDRAVYVEVALPIIPKLDFKIAARNDRLSADSSATTYQTGLSYPVLDILKLRTSYGTGFKAPGLHERFLAASFGVLSAIDPVLCENQNLCEEIEIQTKSTGNALLKPEKSEYYNFGLIAQVANNVSLSADYWHLDVKDKIGSLTLQEILNQEAKYAQYVTRVNNSMQDPDSLITTELLNLTKEESAGVELGANYNQKFGDSLVTAGARFNKVIVSKTQTSLSEPLCDTAQNAKGFDGNVSLDWSLAAFKAGSNVRYHAPYDSYEGGFEAGTCDYSAPETKYRVESQSELDLNVAYLTPIGTEVGLGIQNVTNKAPAFNPNLDGWPWYDQQAYSNMGRFFYVSLEHSFQ